MRSALTLAIGSLLTALPSQPSLSIRHDFEESEYLEFGRQFPAVVQVGGLASGTLIARDWVLTVAHAPEMIPRMKPGQPIDVQVGERTYEVTRVVYPEQRKEGVDGHDIALLQLAEPVDEGVEPVALWTEEVKPGTEFVLAGWGILAIGDEGIELSPRAMTAPTRRLRAGRNVIERLGSDRKTMVARFDDPEDAVELEAGPCIGDSGGPALIGRQADGEDTITWSVAGVIANVEDADEDHVVGEYGEEFSMTVVAAYADWIRATIE